MAVLTFSPGVALVLILGLLLVIGLVAFHRRAAENILWFFMGLLDLYQRWLQLLRASHPSPEQNVKSAEPYHDPSADGASVTGDTTYALSARQQRDASSVMGEQRR